MLSTKNQPETSLENNNSNEQKAINISGKKDPIRIPWNIAQTQDALVTGLIENLNNAVQESINSDKKCSIDLNIVSREFLEYLQLNFSSMISKDFPATELDFGLALTISNPVEKLKEHIKTYIENAKTGLKEKSIQALKEFSQKYNRKFETSYMFILKSRRHVSDTIVDDWKFVFNPICVELLKLARDTLGPIPSNNTTTTNVVKNYQLKETLTFGSIEVFAEDAETQLKLADRLVTIIDLLNFKSITIITREFLKCLQEKKYHHLDSVEETILYDSHLKEIVKKTIEPSKKEAERLLRETYKSLASESNTTEDIPTIEFEFKLPERISDSNIEQWTLEANTHCAALLDILEQNKISILANKKASRNFSRSPFLQGEWLRNKGMPICSRPNKLQEFNDQESLSRPVP